VGERNFEVRSCYHCCCNKAIRITYSECVFLALGIQHAKRVRRIILTFLACSDVPYFSTLSHKRQDFRGEKYLEQYVFSFSLKNMTVIFLILRIIQRDQVTNLYRFVGQISIIIVRF
jgi:hypothetical protein